MKNIIKTGVVVALTLTAQAAFSQVAIVVGAKSTAASLNEDQIKSLFLGKSDQIPGIGTALLLDQAESSPVRDQFYSKVTGKSGSQVKAGWARLVFSGKATPPKELGNSADVKKMVIANANAIGYIDKGSVDGSVKVLFSTE